MFTLFTRIIQITNFTMIFMRNLFFKVLIISILCIVLNSCKSKSNVTKKGIKERTDTTEDVRDEQMGDYEEDMKQLNEENNH